MRIVETSMKKLFAIILMAAFMATGVACTNMSPTQQGVALSLIHI